jgi:hypothetical protein
VLIRFIGELHPERAELYKSSQAEIDGSNENGFGEQNPSLNTTRLMEQHSEGRRLVIHNGDISYARCAWYTLHHVL